MSSFDENPYQSPAAPDSGAAPGTGVIPKLWNPNAAANWSLLLTPAFGASLHAANWRALGDEQKARRNMAWVWATAIFLIVNFGTVFLPESETMDRSMRYAGIGLLLAWYFSQGRPQAKYVKETLHDHYIRRGWGQPLGIGFVAAALYIVAIFVAVLALFAADPGRFEGALGP